MKHILIIFIIILLTGCKMTMQKNIYTEIEIHTPKQVVWDILMDNDAYPVWNPYHVKVEGKLASGERLKVKIHKPNNSEINIEPYVMDIVPFARLSWGGGIKGIFYGEHIFELVSLSESTTRLIQRETFSGLAIQFAELETIEEGYMLMNEALKKRSENLYKEESRN
jgi:hypothetical protein